MCNASMTNGDFVVSWNFSSLDSKFANWVRIGFLVEVQHFIREKTSCDFWPSEALAPGRAAVSAAVHPGSHAPQYWLASPTDTIYYSVRRTLTVLGSTPFIECLLGTIWRPLSALLFQTGVRLNQDVG